MSLDAIATSAFGRRPVTHAQIRAQIGVKAARERGCDRAAGAVNKWTLFRTLTEIRAVLGVSDRALGVLNALLTFHPETALQLAAADGQGACSDLVVHPSNRALALRANGMSEPTLRRHLAALVEAGLIIRRDSPNGKRYLRRSLESGEPAQAFGFDLSPLVARADEFDAALEALQRQRRAQRRLKERVTLLRRDLSKRLAFALDENLPGPWDELRRAFLDLCRPLRRLAAVDGVEAGLADLQREVATRLEQAILTQNSDADAAQSDRHKTNSKPDDTSELEPASKTAGGEAASSQTGGEPPLAVALDACRDIADYHFATPQIRDWADFIAAARLVRPMLGISPDAWRKAVAALGERQAGLAVAFILQRSEHSSEAERRAGPGGADSVTVNGSPAIRSPGGYLRALTEKGRGGDASLWPALLAHLAQRLKRRGPPPGGRSTS
ncbi:MAG: replication initiation protein RepC [Methylobacteriaceae bacterium]|nr:replication initiation protein RepC [Methylobacteriaceae bacterium]